MSDAFAELDRQLDEILPDDELEFGGDESPSQPAAPAGTSTSVQTEAPAPPATDTATTQQPDGEQPQPVEDPFLNTPMPKVAGLPDYLVGKPMSEVIKKLTNQDELIQRQGKEKNDAILQAEALKVGINFLRDEMRQPRPLPPDPTPAAPSFGDFGINPDTDLINDPTRTLMSTAQLAQRLTAQTIDPRIARIEQQLASYEEREKIARVRSAADRARDHLRIDPATWEQAGQFLYSYAGMRDPNNPESWAEGWQALTGLFPAPQRSTVPQVPMTQGTVPGASRPMTVANSPTQAVKPKVTAAVSFAAETMEEALGRDGITLSPEQKAKAAARMTAALAELEGRKR